MPEYSQLDWATPWGALVLMVPLALAFMAHRRRAKLSSWADPHLMPWAVAAIGKGEPRNWRRLADWLAWGLLALAAAGPRLPLEEPINENIGPQRHVVSVLVGLDISASMSASDIAPDRLSRARLELSDFTARLKGERVGLALYAGEAGLLLPPTDDANLFNRALGQAGPDLLEAQGSNVSAVLQLAEKILSAEKPRSRAVLLVTDADADSLAGPAGDAARKAAEKLKAAGMPLFVFAVAGRAGAPIPLADGGFVEHDGAMVESRPALDAYAELARMTGGRLVEVADGDKDWQQLYDTGIANLPGDPIAADEVRAWRTLYTWPLFASLLLFMIAWLPRAATSSALMLAVLMVAPPHDAFAVDSEQTAWQAYRNGRFNDAIRLYDKSGGYEGQMGAGASEWKLKNYPASLRHFGAALLLAGDEKERTDALYNLANAHFALTHWQIAAEAYRAVLQARPNDERAKTNLAVTERQISRQRSDKPIKTDLRGRRGSIAEGEVNLDWDRELAIPESEPSEQTTLVERGNAAGAMHDGNLIAGRLVSPDSRRLQSGLTKLERLQERPRSLLKGLLKQDRAGEAEALELPPW